MRRDTKPSPVRDILENILSHNERLRYEIKIREAQYAWSDITEEYVRTHTKAVYVKSRILYVNVDSSVLANELSLREKEYIKKLNNATNTMVIKKIVFKAGNTIRSREENKGTAGVSGRLPISVLKKIDDTVTHIREGELRDVFRSFLRTTARRNKKK